MTNPTLPPPNETLSPLSDYLEQMVEENYLLTREAQIANRLPEALQEKAVEHSETQRIQAMEQIVSDFLNPKSEPSNAIRDAVGEDVVDHYLPLYGNTGWEIRKVLLKTWQSQRSRSWWKWALALWLVPILLTSMLWVVKVPWHGAQYLWTHYYKANNELYAPPPVTPPLPVVASRSVPKPKALIAPAVVPHPLPIAPSALPPPSEVHADVRTPDLIIVSWRAVAKDARYNVYSSASRDLITLRKENEEPLTSNRAQWTPETGLERYWLVVTTLDADNHESVYSEAIEVVRHPEKSGPGFGEQAAGTLRKVLPW